MRSTSRCADCWTRPTLLAPPDSASNGIDRACVVSLPQVLFRFLVINTVPISRIYPYFLIKCQSAMCSYKETESFTTGRVQSVSISSWWFDPWRFCSCLFLVQCFVSSLFVWRRVVSQPSINIRPF